MTAHEIHEFVLPGGVPITCRCAIGDDHNLGDVERLVPASTSALSDVEAERRRQNEKWGEQNYPDGTGAETRPLQPHLRVNAVPPHAHARDLAAAFTQETDQQAMHGLVTWSDIVLEEVFEALAEDDPAKLRTELIQVAAVAVQWAEAIDRRAR